MQSIFSWHLTILEDQLTGVGAAHTELVEFRRAGESWGIALNDERSNAFGSCLRIGFGIDYVDMGIGAVGDPHFSPVEYVAVALFASI